MVELETRNAKSLKFYVSEMEIPITELWPFHEIVHVVSEMISGQFENINNVVYIKCIGSIDYDDLDSYFWPKGSKFRGEFHAV